MNGLRFGVPLLDLTDSIWSFFGFFLECGPGGIRTPDHLSASQVSEPADHSTAELPAQQRVSAWPNNIVCLVSFVDDLGGEKG